MARRSTLMRDRPHRHGLQRGSLASDRRRRLIDGSECVAISVPAFFDTLEDQLLGTADRVLVLFSIGAM